MYRRLCLFVIALATLAGCTHPVFKTQPIQPPAQAPIWSGTPTQLSEASYFERASLEERFAHEIVDRREPTQARYPYPVGLALSGGGAKAAAYSMGVLQSLFENDILSEDISVVSTVSGGGYAAYWYYSRLADFYLGAQREHVGASVSAESPESKKITQVAPPRPRADEFSGLFCECLPYRYSGLLAVPQQDFGGQCGAVCPKDDERWLSPDGEDRWRYQNHLRAYPDVLSNDFEMGTRSDDLNWDVAKGLGLTLVTLPGYIFTNFIFDWRLEVSPTQRQYRHGIERTFGLQPIDLRPYRSPAEPGKCDGDVIADTDEHCRQERPIPNHLVGRGLTFATLYLARKEQQREFERLDETRTDPRVSIDGLRPRVPLLVVNTTSGVSSTPFDLIEQRFPDFEDSIFEFTPAGYGSRLYGYWPGSHPEVDVATSVSASAAFFDSQQRSMNWPARLAAGSALRLLQLEWGVDIANPALPDRVRGRHAFLPFPFYFLHRQTKNAEAPYIHLADGGQSDNTGVFSLVRRGVRLIVYADAAQDDDGRFDDLCVLRLQLRRKHLHLYIPTLTSQTRNFAKECDSNGSGARAETQPYPLWSFASGVLEGCITRNEADLTCTASETAGYRARLFILKPSINLATLAKPVEECLESGKSVATSSSFGELLDTAACRSAFATAQAAEPELPAEVFGFMVRNWRERNDDHLIFPQHSTWRTTLNSSAWLYGAYKALGAWHTRQLLRARPGLRDGASLPIFNRLSESPASQRTYLQPVEPERDTE